MRAVLGDGYTIVIKLILEKAQFYLWLNGGEIDYESNNMKSKYRSAKQFFRFSSSAQALWMIKDSKRTFLMKSRYTYKYILIKVQYLI